MNGSLLTIQLFDRPTQYDINTLFDKALDTTYAEPKWKATYLSSVRELNYTFSTKGLEEFVQYFCSYITTLGKPSHSTVTVAMERCLPHSLDSKIILMWKMSITKFCDSLHTVHHKILWQFTIRYQTVWKQLKHNEKIHKAFITIILIVTDFHHKMFDGLS